MISDYHPWLAKLARLAMRIMKFNVFLVALIGALLYTFQGKMIYASSMPPGSREKVPKPSDFGMQDWEEIDLVAPDQIKTKAFVILAARRLQKISHPKTLDDWRRIRPVILMLHANAGNVGHRLPIAKVLAERFECNVVAISYRGYGHSSGSPSEKGILLDSETALDYIKSHPILQSSPLFLYGQSLGGAVAIGLASNKLHINKITGIILENTFANMRKLIPVVMPVIGPFSFLCHQTWYSDQRMRQIEASNPPAFLFLSGSKDELIPTSHFRMLYDLCPSQRKSWKAFKDGNHNDTCLQKDYFPTMGKWIEDIISLPKDS